ncbi:ATP-binding protein [Pendulispora rubella]|uniref:histidine kinase n=1 Tax=Pendulispora rubella TaxID=2741070 RepID=A0ABZ2L9Y1_9BACT
MNESANWKMSTLGGLNLTESVKMKAANTTSPGVPTPPSLRTPRTGFGICRRGMLGRILVVDDNTDLVTTLREVLEPHGFVVINATKGQDALRIAETDGFDVAIVDVKLPDTSGVDIIQPLRRASPASEVVLVTGFASVDAAIAALRSGAFAFILKSFRPEELLSTIQQAITKVRLMRDREELERRYRALVELTDVLVIGLDETGHVALFNRRAAALAEIASEEAYGRDFVDTWIPEEDRGRLRESLSQAHRGERLREVETSFVEPNRRVRWQLLPARDSEEKRHHFVYLIGIDVTERRALEKRAADAEALSAMGTLALNLAHEIRNPLNAAVLQLHLMGRDIDKLEADYERRAAMHRRVEIVGSEINRLNRLLTEFLELARPRGIGREPVHIGSLVDDVLELERESAERRGIRIERQIVADGCGVAIGDREKLKQVIINLVVNSIEAMKGGGTLTARVKCGDSNVVLEIVDTGPGIDPELVDNVFDPFFTTKEGGTGLGLSIVRKIIDQHGGDVSITSEKGQGTQVRVRVPSGR